MFVRFKLHVPMRFTALMAIILTVLLLHSCAGNSNDIQSQQNSITKFLESKDAEYTIEGGVYRYIANIDRAGRSQATAVEAGDSVSIYFEAFEFMKYASENSAQESAKRNSLYYTNKQYIIDSIAGLNTQYWSIEPLKIKAGKSDLLKSINNALPTLREGDSVLMFLTSDLAYGDTSIGVLDKEIPILYIMNIFNIKK